MRFVGLDVHRDFCEVALIEDGRLRSSGRVATTPEALELFARSLGEETAVALEATANAWAIARVLRPHVGRVVLTEPSAVHDLAAAKTDKIDARSLATLLASGFIVEVWAPDEATAMLRRQLSRRRQLVKQRTREKNQIHAVLMRNLKGRPPMSDVFGKRGREWLAEQELVAEEREMVEACLRFLPAISPEALKARSARLRELRIHRRTDLSLDDLARWLNPIVAGWIRYYGRFYRTALDPLLKRVNAYLRRWAGRKYTRLRTNQRFSRWWAGLLQRQPSLFAHWSVIRSYA